MISFGMKHCKFDMHNKIIYFHAPFLGIAFKSFIDGKDYCTKCFVRTIDSLYVIIITTPTSFVLLYIFLFMCNAFVFCLKKQDIVFRKKLC